jgi:hypothetical protein
MWWVLYPELCADDPVLGEQAEAQAARLYELAEFLVQVVGVERLGAVFHGKVTCHASCHTRLAAQRPALIAQVQQELDAARVIATLAYYLLLAQTEGVDPQ